MIEQEMRYGFILCVCTGKCPGFEEMDIFDLVNQVRIELPVEYGFIHPQLCEEDGDRFLADFLKAHRKIIVAGCTPTMQKKMFKDVFADAGMSIESDLVPLDIRKMTTLNAFEKIKDALIELGFEENIT